LRNWEIHERVDPDNKTTYYLYRTHLDRYGEYAFLSKRLRVIDVGCGYGFGTSALERCAAHVIGIDVSYETIKSAKRRYSGTRLDFVVMSAEHLGFKGNSFQGAYAFEVIEHLANSESFLNEVDRTLGGEGFLVLSTPNRLASIERNPFHAREFSWNELDSSLRKHFSSVKIVGKAHSQFFSRIMFVRRLLPSEIVDRLKDNSAFKMLIDRIGRQTEQMENLESPPFLLALCRGRYGKSS
jgi:SAM-dependent methyltransferase